MTGVAKMDPGRVQLDDLLSHQGRFFSVIHQTARSQSGQMTVAPGREAGPPETHDADQVFLFLEGEALLRVWDPEMRELRAGPMTLVTVPAGVKHWVKSVGAGPLFFFTVYAPPEY
jgi:mannose-6-phosphate isomerase-like protein (cupin superfamily)